MEGGIDIPQNGKMAWAAPTLRARASGLLQLAFPPPGAVAAIYGVEARWPQLSLAYARRIGDLLFRRGAAVARMAGGSPTAKLSARVLSQLGDEQPEEDLTHSRNARYSLWAGFIAETVAIAARWDETGHVPTVGNYENALAGTWLIILFTLYLIQKHKAFQFASLGTISFSLLILGMGMMSNPTLRPLNVALISFWLYVHIFFAWLAYAAYTVAFAIAVLYVLKDRKETAGIEKGRILNAVPSLAILDDMMFRYIVFGFIMDAIMIASGAIWAKDLWGSYWSWDPRCPLRDFYGAVPLGRPVGFWGSNGLVEMAVNGGSAARRLGLKVGSTVKFLPSRRLAKAGNQLQRPDWMVSWVQKLRARSLWLLVIRSFTPSPGRSEG